MDSVTVDGGARTTIFRAVWHQRGYSMTLQRRDIGGPSSRPHTVRSRCRLVLRDVGSRGVLPDFVKSVGAGGRRNHPRKLPIRRKPCRRRRRETPAPSPSGTPIAGAAQGCLSRGKTLWISPAMAAGIETWLWSTEDVVALVDACSAKIGGDTLVG
jgi:hypothetical protein